MLRDSLILFLFIRAELQTVSLGAALFSPTESRIRRAEIRVPLYVFHQLGVEAPSGKLRIVIDF